MCYYVLLRFILLVYSLTFVVLNRLIGVVVVVVVVGVVVVVVVVCVCVCVCVSMFVCV